MLTSGVTVAAGVSTLLTPEAAEPMPVSARPGAAAGMPTLTARLVSALLTSRRAVDFVRHASALCRAA
jgi:hypothetical protein